MQGFLWAHLTKVCPESQPVMLTHPHTPGHPAEDQSVAPALLWADATSQFTGSSMEGTLPSIPDWSFRGHTEKAGDLESNFKVFLQNHIATSGLISFLGAISSPTSILELSSPWETQGLRAEALALPWRK